MNILKGHRSRVRCLVFSPDGRLLASAGNGRRVRLWDAATGERRGIVSNPTDFVFDLAFSPQGKLLASGGADGRVRLWDVDPLRLGPDLANHDTKVVALDFSGRELLAASTGVIGREGGVEAVVRDVDTGRETAALKLCAGYYNPGPILGRAAIYHARFAPGGRVVALGLDGGRILLWDRAEAPEPPDIPYAPGAAGLRLIRLAEAIPDVAELHDEEVHRVAFSPDGRTLAAAAGKHVLLVDLAAGGSLRAAFKQRLTVRTVAFSPDGALLATCGYDGFVRLLDPADGHERASYQWDVGEVNRVAFAPGGMTAAAAGKHDIVVWDVQEGA